MSLVSEAKKLNALRVSRPITEELKELALAWAKDEIKLRQVQKILNLRTGSGAYVLLARALKAIILESL